MIRVAYYDLATGAVSALLCGPSLEGMPLPAGLQGAVLTDYAGLLPAIYDGSSIIAVPAQPSAAHQWSWPDRTWVLDITAARSDAWARIKAARDAAEFGTFGWAGHIFDGDELSFGRLSQALEAARFAITASDTTFTQPWKLADNSWITLTAQQVFEVYRARGLNTLNAHLHAEALRQQIDAATTITDLDAIQWA